MTAASSAAHSPSTLRSWLRLDRRALAYVRGAGFPLWFLTLIMPFWFQSDFEATMEGFESGKERLGQMAGIGLAIACPLLASKRQWTTALRRFVGRIDGFLLIVFFPAAMFMALGSIDPNKSLMYAALTAAAVIGAVVAWEENAAAVRKMLALSGILQLGFLVLLFFRLGWTGESVGAIQHNQLAMTVMTAMMCCQFAEKRIRWAATAFCLAYIVLLHSRGVLLVSLSFMAIVLLLESWNRRILSILTGFALVGLVVSIFDLAGGGTMSLDLLDRLFHFRDQDRGFGSGFTGRTEYWNAGWEMFTQSPLTGYGFRTRERFLEPNTPQEVNAHCGILNMLLDVGLIGGTLLAGSVVCQLLARIPLAVGAVRSDMRDLQRIGIALICASTIMWVFEPIYINIGASHSIFLIFMAAAPLAHNGSEVAT